MKFVSQIIGEEYKQWKRGQTIYLTSPTGSGKTTFIFDFLLPYFVENNMKILYLVNRKVLKKQLKKKISNLPVELSDYIHVETYQTLEEKIIDESKDLSTHEYASGYMHGVADCAQFFNIPCEEMELPPEVCVSEIFPSMNYLDSFDCVVCDECHYFLVDSNFNKNTILSFNFIRKHFGHKLTIFISATIADFKKYVDDFLPFGSKNRTNWFGKKYSFFTFPSKLEMFEDYKKEYTCDRNYDYIDLQFLHKRSDVANIISKNEGRWLVFVDSKKYGKELKREIDKINKEQDGQNITAAFVTSDYELDEESFEQVSSIVDEERQTADVLISTSVLDNGINLADANLRNIIIMADNETEFIQMLGRRRVDNQRIKVYAVLYEKGHFQNRINMNNNRMKVGKEFNAKIIRILNELNANKNCDISLFRQYEYIEELKHSRYLMDHIFSYSNRIKYTYLSYRGILRLNPLSLNNLINLNSFYFDMVNQFESGDSDAFANAVLRWLNLEQQCDLERMKLTQYEKSRQNVIAKFEEKANIAFSMFEYEKEVREPIENDLKILFNQKQNEIPPKKYNTYSRDCARSGKVITRPMMEALKDYCKIPYQVVVENGIYKISPIEETDCKKIQED